MPNASRLEAISLKSWGQGMQELIRYSAPGFHKMLAVIEDQQELFGAQIIDDDIE